MPHKQPKHHQVKTHKRKPKHPEKKLPSCKSSTADIHEHFSKVPHVEAPKTNSLSETEQSQRNKINNRIDRDNALTGYLGGLSAGFCAFLVKYFNTPNSDHAQNALWTIQRIAESGAHGFIHSLKYDRAMEVISADNEAIAQSVWIDYRPWVYSLMLAGLVLGANYRKLFSTASEPEVPQPTTRTLRPA